MNDYSIGRICYRTEAFMSTGFGAWMVTSKYEILNAEKYNIIIDDIGNGKAWVENRQLDSSKCRQGFYDRNINDRTYSYTNMLGAICGDVAGSVYEHKNIKCIPDTETLIQHHAHFTDDSVMTLAVAAGIKNAMNILRKTQDFTDEDDVVFLNEIAASVRKWGRRYPNAGYGGSFRKWLAQPDAGPYGSWGNGSAMRASYAGWIARSLKDAEYLAGVSAKITHDHPEGIKGAIAIAGSIYLVLHRSDKSVSEAKNLVRDYVGKLYDMNFTLEEIRPTYHFDVSCQGSVPMAVEAFLEGNSFSEVLALAISIGGDSDTIAAMAGSLAETIYPIPEGVRNRVLKRLDYEFKSELAGTIDYLRIP